MRSLLLAALLTLPQFAAAQTAPSLTVRFHGIETPTGRIMLSVYDDQRAFDEGGQPVRGVMATIEGDVAVATFAGLPPGRYAIKAFHDIDGDGAMKTNPFGMPLEPYAFSNDAKPQGGPPRWAAASFDLPATGAAIRIAIQ